MDGMGGSSWYYHELSKSSHGEGINSDYATDGPSGQPNVAYPTRTTSDLPTCVNPADLQRRPEAVLDYTNQTDTPPVPDNVVGFGVQTSSTEEIFAMDEFFRSQGGWRPPVPCTHCKRLRLQCFMLQTTSANPNPVSSCSSCVALYRQCSLALAGPAKRQASLFETPRPVIGQLHGVYEDEHDGPPAKESGNHVAMEQPTTPDPATRASKRSSSRSNTRTRPLRLWFSDHYHDPYPSESEKFYLIRDSGLSRTQIDNWFSNARRRKKHSEQTTSLAINKIHREGSPMPTSELDQMTPLERWQHSPPDIEPAQLVDIERAVGTASTSSSFDALQHASTNVPSSLPFLDLDFDSDMQWLSLPCSVDSSSTAVSSSSSQSSYGARSSSSKRSHEETGLDAPSQKRRQHTKQSTFRCADCGRTFTRNSDLLRHERAIHLHLNKTWICSNLISPDESALVWRMSQPGPECALCGHLNPDGNHVLSHEFVACADRDVAERTFTRRDHLWQHLYKFHRCRKWDGWALDHNVDRLRQV